MPTSAMIGITIIPKHRYPKAWETRSVAALNRIYAKYGADHLRFVLMTAVQTENNASALEASFLWCVSDLYKDFKAEIEADKKEGVSRWYAAFDSAPVDKYVFYLSGKKQRRYMLRGILWERVRAVFAREPELFQERAA